MTDWLPWLTHRAGQDSTWWVPDVGEQVVVLAPSGELNQAVVLPAIFSGTYPASADSTHIAKTVYKDGTTVSYDRDSHVMMVEVAVEGRIELRVGNSSVVITDLGITLKGSLIDLG